MKFCFLSSHLHFPNSYSLLDTSVQGSDQCLDSPETLLLTWTSLFWQTQSNSLHCVDWKCKCAQTDRGTWPKPASAEDINPTLTSLLSVSNKGKCRPYIRYHLRHRSCVVTRYSCHLLPFIISVAISLWSTATLLRHHKPPSGGRPTDE